MYKGNGGRFYQTCGDFAVAVFLRDPKTVAGETRKYCNSTISDGQSYSVTLGPMLVIKSFGMLFQLTPTGSSCPSHGRMVHIRVHVPNNNVTVFDKDVPYSPTCGFSITDLTSTVLTYGSNYYNVLVTVTNNTGVPLNLGYITSGPLAFFNGHHGLVGCDCGESLGDDEYYPRFGVSQMYGSFKVRELSKSFISVLNNPTSYGLSSDLVRMSLRTEVYVGTQMAALMETDEFSFSNDGKEFEVSLKDVISPLDSVYVGGPRVIELGSTKALATVLQEFFSYEKTKQPANLGHYDFSTVYQSVAYQRFRSKPIVLDGETTMLGFIEKLGNATLCNIGVRHVVEASMAYGFFVYSNILTDKTAPQDGGSVSDSLYHIRSADIFDDVEYTPLRKNYIDKITYANYEVGLSEEEESFDITYDLVNVNPYRSEHDSASDDKAAFFEYWKGKSRSSMLPANNPDETTYGMRIPRPSDIYYDDASGKYVARREALEKSEARALTRGFLWRFSFPESFEGNPFASTTVSSVLSQMETLAQYGGPEDGSYNTDYLVWPRGQAISFSDYVFSYSIQTPGGGTSSVSVRANNTLPSKMFWPKMLFENIQDLYTLHYRVPRGYYIVSGNSYRKKKSFSFWFTYPIGYNPWLQGPDWNYDDREWTPMYNHDYIEVEMNPQDWNSPFNQPSATWFPPQGFDEDKISTYLTVRATANMKTAYLSGNDRVYQSQRSGVFNTYENGEPFVMGAINQVGMCNDIDGGYTEGGGFNTNDSVASGERTIWSGWAHSNFGGSQADADATADADYIAYSYLAYGSSFSAEDAEQAENGDCFFAEKLPSANTLRGIIAGSPDNFLNGTQKKDSDWRGTENVNDPGQYFAQNCNGYFTLWSIAGLSAIKNITQPIADASNPDSTLKWVNPRPSFGFCIKGVKYTLEGRFAKVTQGDYVTKQFNRANKYNYDLDDNELTFIFSVNVSPIPILFFYQDVLTASLSRISSRYSNGSTVYWVKSAVFGQRIGASNTSSAYVRNYYLNDYVGEITPMKNGVDTNVVDTEGVYVRSVEYVMDGGESYVNLRLMR